MTILTAWFPFSMEPDSIVGNIKYTKECYESILDQLKNGIGVYDGTGIDSKCIGTTVRVDGNRISIRITDNKFIGRVIDLNEKFSVGTTLEGDGDLDNDGVHIINKAIVNRVALIPTPTKHNIDKYVIGYDVAAKESTLKTSERLL